jgi:stage III sporulation protein SpoIIIAA
MVLHANSHSDTDCSREEGDRDGSEDTVEGWEPALWTATGQRTKDILTASNFLRLWPDDFKDLVAEESERAQFWKLVPLDLASLIVTSCEARQLDPRLVEEVVMDLHRPIRIRLSSTAEETFVATAIVTEQHIADILRTAQPVLFRNRFGMNNTLHRISVMHSHLDETKVIGMTMRYGRPVPGCLALIPDVVLSGKSVLLVGRGGAGKTTCLREFARILSDFCKKRTMIVDTTNEIGGMGEAMHPSVGRLSRRMPVKNADHLHDYMLRAVENHSSQIILIDEISNRKQCMAASSIRDRGVQMIASAHGETLVSVLENPELSVLVGGAETVIFSDAEARENGMQSKVAQQRRARPVFDIIVEMRDRQHWVVHQDVRTAVDSLLSVDGCCIGEERTYGEYQQVLARPCTLHRR